LRFIPAGPARPLSYQILKSLPEVGAGLGLHARYLLDEFQAPCGDAGTDYYQRLRFTVTDGSINAVRAWAQAGLFSGHEAKVQLAVCDANDLSHATTLRGETLLLPPFRAILFNYMLDVLPAGQFRRTPGGWEELRIRQLRRKDAGAASCSVEARFFPVAAPSRFLAHARAAESRVVVVNESALACLEQALARLAAPGFILINDDDKREDRPGPDRFGRTLAWGLNFALLEQHFSAQGATLCRPANEENAPIYARLLMREPHDNIAATFDAAFSAAGGAGAKHTTGKIAGSGVESKFADSDSAAQALHSALNTEAGKFALTNLAKLKDGRAVLTSVSAAKPPAANTALKTSVPALKLSGDKHAPAIVSVLDSYKGTLKLAALYKTPDVAAFYKTPDLGAFYKTPDLGALYKTPDAPAAAASKPQGKVSASKAAVLYFTSTAQDSVVVSSGTTLAPLKSVTVTNPIAHKPW